MIASEQPGTLIGAQREVTRDTGCLDAPSIVHVFGGWRRACVVPRVSEYECRVSEWKALCDEAAVVVEAGGVGDGDVCDRRRGRRRNDWQQLVSGREVFVDVGLPT